MISTFSDTAELWLYTRWSYAPSLCFVHPLSCAADSQHVCPKTKTKSSWAKRGPDNKNNLVFTCFPSILPSVHAILKIRFPFHTNTRKKDGCVHSVWVSTCLHLKNKKCVPETKRRGSYWHLCLIPILSHYFNSIFPHLQLSDKAVSPDLPLCTHRWQQEEVTVKVLCWGPRHFSLVLHIDSLWTRGQEHMGWKSLQINAWQWKCSCSWKSVGTAMHESNSWDWMLVKHTRLHNSTSCFSQCLSVKLKVSTLYKPTWKVGRNCPLFSLQAFSSELCIYRMTTRSIEYIHPKYLLKVYKLNFGSLR